MAKFFVGLLTGLVIGLSASAYFSDTDLNGAAYRLRTGIMRYIPGAN
jgi:hypothetical protein